MPSDYLSYHKSFTEELHAVRDRIKQLVGNRLTSGEHKESALRMMLRRHLPPSLVVGRGFVVTDGEPSQQIDVLIVDGNRPCLYKDGDLMIVTPDAVRGIVEVKTGCALTSKDKNNPAEIESHLTTLAEKGALCERVLRKNNPDAKVWTGLFVFDGANQLFDPVLTALGRAFRATGHNVNCVSFGKADFFRYWSENEIKDGGLAGYKGDPLWHAYRFPDPISASYFIGNLLDATSHVDRRESAFAWFPMIGGKEEHRRRRLFEKTLRLADAYED